VLITLFSLFSFDFPKTDKNFFNIPHFDKIVHFGFYFVVAILGSFFVRERFKKGWDILEVVKGATFFAIVYGTIIEVLQYALDTGRDGSVWDALANSAGALIAFLLLKLFFVPKGWLK